MAKKLLEIDVSATLTRQLLAIEQQAGFRAQSLTFAFIPAGVTLRADWTGILVTVVEGDRIEGEDVAQMWLSTSGTSSTKVQIFVSDVPATYFRVAGIVKVLDASSAIIYPASHAETAVIYNVALTLANTEYSQTLPTGTKKFSVALRDYTTFRLAFESGKVATPTEPYKTVLSEYYEDLVRVTGFTLYFASATAGKTAEIVAWS